MRSLDWLESPGGARVRHDRPSLVCHPRARRAGQDEAAAALLAEIEATPDGRGSQYYAVYLPMMVRAAVTLGNPQLAERLVAGHQPRYPIAEHALVTANAVSPRRAVSSTPPPTAIAAAKRWEQFGAILEQAYALLGQGRCLTALGRPAQATEALRGARAIYQTLRAAPALAETDTLLQHGDALTA